MNKQLIQFHGDILPSEKIYDIIVIGSGLAGLTAGVSLLQHGHKVAIIEQREGPGGLCGNWISDGFEFPLACNDFGLNGVKILRNLGVEIKFLPIHSNLYVDQKLYCLSNLFQMAFQLSGYTRDMAKVYIAIRKGNNATILEYIQKEKIHEEFVDLMGVIGAFFGIPLQYLRLQHLKGMFSQNEAKRFVPIGGPQVVTDALFQLFINQGGRIVFNANAKTIENDGKRKVILTDHGECFSKKVISTYPIDRKLLHKTSGLHFGQIFFGVKNSFCFPNYQIFHMPKNAVGWLSELDQGKLPNEFYYVVSGNVIPNKQGRYYTLSCAFCMPREKADMDQFIHPITDYILQSLENYLPGINNAIVFKYFVSPKDFEQRYKLSSKLVSCLLPNNSDIVLKSLEYDEEKDIYYAGACAIPVFKSTGHSIQSGAAVANRVHRELLHHPKNGN